MEDTQLRTDWYLLAITLNGESYRAQVDEPIKANMNSMQEIRKHFRNYSRQDWMSWALLPR